MSAFLCVCVYECACECACVHVCGILCSSLLLSLNNARAQRSWAGQGWCLPGGRPGKKEGQPQIGYSQGEALLAWQREKQPVEVRRALHQASLGAVGQQGGCRASEHPGSLEDDE